jgi:hypothetical protein
MTNCRGQLGVQEQVLVSPLIEAPPMIVSVVVGEQRTSPATVSWITIVFHDPQFSSSKGPARSRRR